MSTPLYRWYRNSDPEESAFIEQVWGPTPWMVRTNARQEGRDWLDVLNKQARWCRDNIGASCDFEQAGVWRHGYAIHDDKRWFGFANEELMNRFINKWGGVTTP